MELLKQQLVQSMPVPAAMSLAIIIENGMNIYKSYEREQKDYHAKARQLVVNLKVSESSYNRQTGPHSPGSHANPTQINLSHSILIPRKMRSCESLCFQAT